MWLLRCARYVPRFREWVRTVVTSWRGGLTDRISDETVVNGAQLFYRPQFGIDGNDSRSTWLTGLLNSSPYLCSAFIGCWLTTPFNKYFGRRGTVFLTCLFSALACFWQGFVNTWWHMFIARFFLGIGIGPKSATVPIYAAETAPPAIRGALTMQWQMWTAFGIMLGYISDLIFYKVPDPPGIVGLNWRIMMASAMFPALIVVLFVFACPESPRWYMSQNRHYKAYQSMIRLRFSKVQAARDVFYIHVLLEAEKEVHERSGNPILELIKVPRNRRAMVASEIVMFMQQVSLPPVLPPTLLALFWLTHTLVLRCQCNSLLLFPNLPRRRLLPNRLLNSLTGLRHHQLALRHPGSLHNRHLWPSKPPLDHFPPHVPLSLLHRLLLPNQRQKPAHSPHHLHRRRDIYLRHGLLTRGRSRPIHLRRRSLPSLHPHVRHVAIDSDDMVL